MELRRRREAYAEQRLAREAEFRRAEELRREAILRRDAEIRREREPQSAPPPRPVDFQEPAADQSAAAARSRAVVMSVFRAETEEAALRFMRGPVPPLRGSLASLERQDQRLEAEGLQRIEDEADLRARIADRLLVPLPASNALTVNPSLSPLRRYTRPWTAQFLVDLSRAYAALFHQPLKVNSAVRTVAYQEKLMRINGNAAPAEGSIISPHIMGATVDLAKKDMSIEELYWMRRVLLALELEGKIDVEEEFYQACFHITVYKSYASSRMLRSWGLERALSRTADRSAVPPHSSAQPEAAASALMASSGIASPGQ